MKRVNNKKRIIKNKLKMAVIVIMFVLLTSISVSSVVLAGNKKEPVYTYYTSVEIKPGDSLWSIADKYCDGTGLSVKEYIDTIKSINHLGNNNITSGQYLIVMYVSDEYK